MQNLKTADYSWKNSIRIHFLFSLLKIIPKARLNTRWQIWRQGFYHTPYLVKIQTRMTNEQEGLNLKTRFTAKTVYDLHQLVKAGLGVSLIRL